MTILLFEFHHSSEKGNDRGVVLVGRNMPRNTTQITATRQISGMASRTSSVAKALDGFAGRTEPISLKNGQSGMTFSDQKADAQMTTTFAGPDHHKSVRFTIDGNHELYLNHRRKQRKKGEQQKLEVESSATQNQTRPLNFNRLPPALSSFIDEQSGNVTGDPQILLQYAIVGFGKCGTTSLHQIISSHPQTQVLEAEIWALVGKQPHRLIKRLFRKLKDPNKIRGYKCPGDILADYVTDYYQQYWPKTDMFVALRHPVKWFQSLYNFRVQNFQDFESIPHPNNLIGLCSEDTKLLCTRRGHFAYYLMRLGKQMVTLHNTTGAGGESPRRAVLSSWTPQTDLDRDIFEWYGHYANEPETVSYKPNRVFLLEINQLADSNQTRQAMLRDDIQNYLGLEQAFPNSNPIHFIPGKEWEQSIQEAKNKKKIDICEDEYSPVREELMYLAVMASRYVREVFLNLPDVYVSSRDYFEQLLETWMIDPCDNQSRKLTIEESFRIAAEKRGLRNAAARSTTNSAALSSERLR